MLINLRLSQKRNQSLKKQTRNAPSHQITNPRSVQEIFHTKRQLSRWKSIRNGQSNHFITFKFIVIINLSQLKLRLTPDPEPQHEKDRIIKQIQNLRSPVIAYVRHNYIIKSFN